MSTKDKGTTMPKKKNVQVVVRVRPLSDKEKAERAHLAVRTNGLAQTVSIKDRSNWREFGPFDKVYGMDSSQSTIYLDIVDPLVKEVIQGYNCTIFAYGQTGTGKTFTMEGEHDPDGSYSWRDDPRMGIIPRALMQIFAELEQQKVEEYSVRVSYVELYNEELNDLLNRSEQTQSRLRIFEDAVRKGSVVITGLEEVAVRERDEVYDLLRRGADKRKTAATFLNAASSRSHSVFTVTVVIRENSMGGEELMKQGKLHLVDLAGSENIGRSGAIEMRAREAEELHIGEQDGEEHLSLICSKSRKASSELDVVIISIGNINQSLLTLGRVIKALTSGAGHIPYRESKLTRILQDSLGGKTITTVIATLSPSSTNVEESMNTLEYACSAKNIKNHPEINQKLSRRALLRQYNDELEKLKKDLQAARDKTGIYLDKENFEEMQARLSDQTEQIDDLSDKLSATMSQLQTLMQDIEVMDEHYARAYERCLHLTEKLRMRNDEIAALKLELAETKAQLEDQKRAVSMLQDAGDSSQSQAVELIENCVSLSGDLGAAIDKIDLLRDICAKNSAQLEDMHRDHTLETQSLMKQTDEWNNLTQEQSSVIDSNCSDLLERLESGANTLSEQIAKLGTQIERSAIAMENAIKVAHDEAVAACGVRTDNVVGAIANMKLLHSHCVQVFKTLVEETNKRLDNVSEQHAALSKSIEVHLSEEKRLNDQLFEERLNQQNRLAELKEDFRLKLESMAANFFASFDSMTNEMIGAVDKEGEERSIRSSKFHATQTAQLNAGNVEVKELRCAAISATGEIEQKAALFTEGEEKLVADVMEEKNQEIARSESLKASVESCSAEMRSFVSAECQLADENVVSLVKTVEDSTAEIADTAALIASSGESSLSKVKKTMTRSQEQFDDFVCNKFERVTSTGGTPLRVTRVFPTEPVEIPDASQLLQQWAENAPVVGRRSFYRPRESLLELPSNVLSPQTLKGVRPKLEDVPEHDDEDEENMPEKARGSNVTRRRPYPSIHK